MQRSTQIGLGLGGLLLLIGAVLWMAGAFGGVKPTPDELIAETLNDAKAAARRRDSGGILDAISEKFQGGDLNKQRLRLLVLQSLRQSRGTNYDVSVLRPQISEIPGQPDKRIVVSKFDVFYSDNGESIWGSSPLTMVMEKETRRKWLFFSEPKWRIVSVPSLPPGIGGDDSGSGLPTLTPIP